MGRRFEFLILLFCGLLPLAAMAGQTSCSPPGAPLKAEKIPTEALCRLEMERNGCTELFNEVSEIKKYARDCSKPATLSTDLWHRIKLCTEEALRGAGTTINDSIVAQIYPAQAYTITPVEDLSVPENDREATLERCAKDVGCKTYLIRFIDKTPLARPRLNVPVETAVSRLRSIQDAKNPELHKMMLLNYGVIMNYYKIPSLLTRFNQKLICLNEAAARNFFCYQLLAATDPVTNIVAEMALAGTGALLLKAAKSAAAARAIEAVGKAAAKK